VTAPEVNVRVGLAGVDTPTSSAAPTYTDVTEDLELEDSGAPVEIVWGRQDEIAQADPNSCTLTFAASAFRMEASGPSAELEIPNQVLVIGQPLQVRGRADGYSYRQRFFGYIASITPLWPDGDVDHLRVEVRAESRLAWLARAKDLQDRTSAAILAAGATSYWPMTERIVDDNNVSDPSPPWFEFDEQPYIRAMGNNPAGLSAAFGWQPGTASEWGPSPDGLPVANFEIAPQPVSDPKIDAAQVGPIPVLSATSAWTVLMIARAGRGPLTDARKFVVFALRGRDDLGFYTAPASLGYLQLAWFATSDEPFWSITAYDAAGALAAAEFGTVFGDNAPRDKKWHLYTFTSSGGATPTVNAYRDETLVATAALTAGEMSDFNSISVGNMAYVPDGDAFATDPRHEFGRLAIINGTALSAGEIGDLYETIITGSIGDGDGVQGRLTRWFEYTGFPAARLTVTSPGATPLTTQDVNGANPLQLLQDVASTDGGVLFDDTSADTRNTTYYGRSVRLTAEPSVTLDVAGQEVASGLTTPVDLSAMVNSVTVAAADGSAKVTRADGDSIALYGYSGEEQTLITSSAAHLRARADWRLHTSAVPHPRAPGLSLQLATLSEVQQDAILGLGMWSIVSLSGLPSEVDGIPASFFIEGGTETWGFQSVEMTLNVTDATPELEVGIYDTGLFDTATFG
jgi:hypothetical protein